MVRLMDVNLYTHGQANERRFHYVQEHAPESYNGDKQTNKALARDTHQPQIQVFSPKPN